MKQATYQRIGCLTPIAAVIVGAVLLFALFGCKTRTEYIPIENTHTEYRDRIVEHTRVDTINNTEYVFCKGDSVIIYREKERVKIVNKRDTITLITTDTITKTRQVEKQLSKWQRAKIEVGGIAIGATALAIVALIIYIIIRIKKKL